MCTLSVTPASFHLLNHLQNVNKSCMPNYVLLTWPNRHLQSTGGGGKKICCTDIETMRNLGRFISSPNREASHALLRTCIKHRKYQ